MAEEAATLPARLQIATEGSTAHRQKYEDPLTITMGVPQMGGPCLITRQKRAKSTKEYECAKLPFFKYITAQPVSMAATLPRTARNHMHLRAHYCPRTLRHVTGSVHLKTTETARLG